ncbi:MAG: hypothetical protein K0V04_04520 [Deltaproteobacteria bacterium]|nr:hypothetical protein [Deltaproteobacteria bacterium]
MSGTPTSARSIDYGSPPWIRDGLSLAFQRWPDLQVPVRPWLDHVAARGLLDTPQPRERVADLVLAWGCARGDAIAIGHFVRELGPVLRATLGTRGDTDDALQHGLAHILVAAPGRAARIVSFAGRSSLRSWVKVVARRLGHQHHRGPPLVAAAVVETVLDHHADPELEALKTRYTGHFESALQSAITTLDARDRTLLRSAMAGERSSSIAARYGVHKATVKRWLATLRQRILRRTRRELLDGLQLRGEELDSILRLIASRIPYARHDQG